MSRKSKVKSQKSKVEGLEAVYIQQAWQVSQA